MVKINKVASFLVAMTMAVGLLAGCSPAANTSVAKPTPSVSAQAQTSEPSTMEQPADEQERISISATYYQSAQAETDAVYDYFTDKFNIDLEMIGVSPDSLSETNNIAIPAGTMYDWMMWDLNYATYLSYVKQGLLKPLPEGWEQTYPNLYGAMQASGILEQLYVDGKAYAIPKTVYYNFAKGDTALWHMMLYYRADWMEQLGMQPWGDTVTISQATDFFKAAVEKDLAGNGNTIGLSGSTSHLTSLLMQTQNGYFDNFTQVEGQYVWGPTLEGTTDGIAFIKNLYNQKLLDPDFYLATRDAAQNLFCSGLSAGVYTNGTVSNFTSILNNAQAAGLADVENNIKSVVVTDDQGVWRGAQASNYWMASIFSPQMEDAKFDRLLSMIDYLFTEEAELIINMGLEGVDWENSANGGYNILMDPSYANVREKYPSCWFWRFAALCPDEFSLVNPSENPVVQVAVNNAYAARAESAAKNGYIELDYNVSFLGTQAKADYSVNIIDEVVRIAVDDKIGLADIQQEWDRFIENYKQIWQPVVDDLNATQQ